MNTISRKELAAIVSQALEAAGIHATLSGGGAVSIYSEGMYVSNDLDFVTSTNREQLSAVLAPLAFTLQEDGRHFVSKNTDLFLEFPAGPLAFGDRQVEHDDIPLLETEWGPLRIITPTQCIMDRLIAFWHWNDRQSWEQALMVARNHDVDVQYLRAFAVEEGADPEDIDRLISRAGR